MRRIGFVLLSAALAALVGACCFAVGGRVGSSHGYLVGTRSNGVVAATMAVSSMNATAKGDTETARGLLEMLVDSALISEWSLQKTGWERPFYVPAEYDLDLETAVGRLAGHRKSHPRPLEHETADSMIDEIVARHTGSDRER